MIFSCFRKEKMEEEKGIRSEKKLPLRQRIWKRIGGIFRKKQKYIEMGIKARGINERKGIFVVI